ncbi:right-handed parallel beta-helix repeat-containing protein [Kineococcus xinjiangensis]|nr:right-handed parallel beta-helix repeat-containing protein [Kineococcus xinjiangensis]
MSTPRRRGGYALVAAALVSAGSAAAGPLAHAETSVASVKPLTDSEEQRSAALVAAEDRRLTEIRTVTAVARWQGEAWKKPYRLSTGTGFTLVLTPRSEPYTVADLLQLAPQTFLKMSDGSYLLTEHVIVSTRATLRLSQPGGLTVRLASSPKGFTSIVSLGGKLQLAGEEGAPVRIESWNADAGAPDTELVDGRAYLRALGGQFHAEHAQLSKLGFWSGRTGGLSLTGTDRPNTGAIEPLANIRPGAEQLPSVLEGVSAQPAGPLEPGQENPNLDYSVPAFDYVSTRIENTTIEDNAYGLFITGANGLHIGDSRVERSLIGGVILHRYVSNGVIERTVASGNRGNGITLDRATTGISLNGVTASDNEMNGVSMSGEPLAAGPSATGATTVSYGRNSVTNGTFQDNGHYGIEVIGGLDVGVQNNRLAGNSMGIVVRSAAERVSVTGNEVARTERHGIALIDGVRNSTVTGNLVKGARTGIYLRDSVAEVRGNTVQEASSHGVSLVGRAEGAEVSYNVLAGAGASALDTARSTGDFAAASNEVEGWDDTTPWYYWFKKLLQPMTALWTLIVLLVVTSALRGRSRTRTVEHPYAHQMAHQGALPIPAPRTIDLRDDAPALSGAR